MTFQEALHSDKFIVTVDTIPPKGIDLSSNFEKLHALKGRVDGVNAVDMPSAVMRMNSLALGRLLSEQGFDPIIQMTCRDRNRLGLQADLLGAAALGLKNILVLGGDEIELSDDPNAKPVFDLDAVGLLKIARGLEQGVDSAGKKLKGSPSFCIGAALDPYAVPLEVEVEKMDQKINAGAEFFQTQPIFDTRRFIEYLDRYGLKDTPVIAGIFLLKSAKMARFMNENVPGVTVPEDIIGELENSDEVVRTSLEIALRTIRAARDSVKGVHIMTIGWEDKIPSLLDSLEM